MAHSPPLPPCAASPWPLPRSAFRRRTASESPGSGRREPPPTLLRGWTAFALTPRRRVRVPARRGKGGSGRGRRCRTGNNARICGIARRTSREDCLEDMPIPWAPAGRVGPTGLTGRGHRRSSRLCRNHGRHSLSGPSRHGRTLDGCAPVVLVGTPLTMLRMAMATAVAVSFPGSALFRYKG